MYTGNTVSPHIRHIYHSLLHNPPSGFTLFLFIVPTLIIVYFPAGHYMGLVIFHHVVSFCQLDSVIWGSFVFACHLEFRSCLICFQRRCFHGPSKVFPPQLLLLCFVSPPHSHFIDLLLLVFCNIFSTGDSLCYIVETNGKVLFALLLCRHWFTALPFMTILKSVSVRLLKSLPSLRPRPLLNCWWFFVLGAGANASALQLLHKTWSLCVTWTNRTASSFLDSFTLPLCSAVCVSWCVSNEWAFCSLAHNYC